MEDNLTNAFAGVRAEIGHEVSKIRELLKTQASLLRSKLLTRMDDKMSTFASTHPVSSCTEPPLIHDVSFSGDPQHLDSFLYSIYNALSAHGSLFTDDGRRIKWIA